MTIQAIGFVPAAPLLIPAVAGAAAAADTELRAKAVDAVRGLVMSRPSEIIVVAPVSTNGDWSDGATWDFAGFGVPRTPESNIKGLPWQLGIGAWLLDEAAWSGQRRYVGVTAGSTEPVEGLAAGAAVLAIGDGSACRTEKAPGHLDPRAAAFDATLARCLADGDVDSLAATDPALADELMCAGLPVWRWLATAINGQSVESAEVTVDTAPYGVGYFVASWVLV